jgi:hypothetical protein
MKKIENLLSIVRTEAVLVIYLCRRPECVEFRLAVCERIDARLGIIAVQNPLIIRNVAGGAPLSQNPHPSKSEECGTRKGYGKTVQSLDARRGSMIPLR